jgi:hypothetical protein
MLVVPSKVCFWPSFPVVARPHTSRAARSGRVEAGKIGSDREKGQLAAAFSRTYVSIILAGQALIFAPADCFYGVVVDPIPIDFNSESRAFRQMLAAVLPNAERIPF